MQLAVRRGSSLSLVVGGTSPTTRFRSNTNRLASPLASPSYYSCQALPSNLELRLRLELSLIAYARSGSQRNNLPCQLVSENEMKSQLIDDSFPPIGVGRNEQNRSLEIA